MVTAGDQALPAELLRFARELPPTILESVCRRLEALPSDASADDRAQVALQISNPEMRHALAKVIRECAQASPGLSPERLAWFLRGASAMDQARRTADKLELVWTGPTTEAIPTRRTDQVLLDVITGAERELLLVSYAAYKVPELVEAMKAALARGVRILFVMEGMDAGTLKFDRLPAFGKEVAEKSEVYYWPTIKRPCDARGNPGALHVKCAIADRKTLLVTSANLTEAALDRNMELGLHVGGEVPLRVWNHFLSLIRDGVLVRQGTVVE
jgi:phosphatidylserine/phosphatidylglycerophosphate/cardiolipin synthase-like enzyme